MVTRLCDVLIIQAIRSWIDTDPSQEWTATTLASEVGMSRSGFSARFSELVGTSPKHYVTEWRMLIAEDVLCRGDTSAATDPTPRDVSDGTLNELLSRVSPTTLSSLERWRDDVRALLRTVWSQPASQKTSAKPEPRRYRVR